MKRPIVAVTLCYAAGLAVGSLLRIPPLAALSLIALIVISQIAALARNRPAVDALLFTAIFLIGTIQAYRLDAALREARRIVAELEKHPTVRLEGRLVSTERNDGRRFVFRLADCRLSPPGGNAVALPAFVHLSCSGEAFMSLSAQPPLPGDTVHAVGALRSPPDLRNPDVFNYRAWQERRGIAANMSVRSADAVVFSPPSGRRSFRDILAGAGERLRRYAERTFDSVMDARSAALNRSIFLGQTERLDRAVRRDFTQCGLAHIFAVSGLNVAMVAWVLDTVLRLFQMRPTRRSAVLILCSVGFCAMVGFQPSVVRATVMFCALMLIPFLRYKIEPMSALAAAALVLLGLTPRALWDAGFQMSFLCMLSIILLKSPLDAWWSLDAERGSERRKRWARVWNHRFLPGLTILLAAQIGAIPLLAGLFHMLPLTGLAATVPAAPLVWAVMAGSLLLLGVSVFVPPLVMWIGNALELFNHSLLWIVREAARNFPLAAVFMPAWPVWFIVLYYAFLYGWVVLPHAPSPFFEKKQRARLALGAAVIAAVVVWAPIVLRSLNAAPLQATFLDVGQGDCCVVELPGGATVLVDAGDYSVRAGERMVVPFLESRGIDYLDAVIVTHPDADHIGGLPAVFNDLVVEWLLEGPAINPTSIYQRLTDAARREGARQDRVFAGDRIEMPSGAQIRFLHPPRQAAYSQRNNLSLVLKIEAGSCWILIAGDIEAEAERDLLASGADLACDVLKVAHHGAASATSDAWIARTRPRLAVISCGAGNPFGHPSPEVLERLTSAGATVLRTDRDGAISIHTSGRTLHWRAEGKP